jgi:hypothetical protein
VCVCVSVPHMFVCESCPPVPHPTTRPHLHNTPNHTRDSPILSLSLSISLSRSRARVRSHSCTTLLTNQFSSKSARDLSLSLPLIHAPLSLSHTRVSLSLIHASLSLAYTHTHLHDTLNQTISSKHDISVSPVSTREDTVSREMPTPFDISTLCSSEHLRTTLFGFPAASA